MIEPEESSDDEAGDEVVPAEAGQPATSGRAKGSLHRRLDLTAEPHTSLALKEKIGGRVVAGFAAAIVERGIAAPEGGHDSQAASAATDDASYDLQLGLDDLHARRKSPQELGH
jgi:hypothetical protein